MTIANTDEQLLSFVRRLVKLSEEKRDLQTDIKEVKKEAKAAGYDVKALSIVVKHEMEDAEQREKREQTGATVELMKAALGAFVSTPLGEAAMERV